MLPISGLQSTLILLLPKSRGSTKTTWMRVLSAQSVTHRTATHHIYELTLDSADGVGVPRLVVDNCHVVVADVHLLLVQAFLQVPFHIGHQGGSVEHHLKKETVMHQVMKFICELKFFFTCIASSCQI